MCPFTWDFGLTVVDFCEVLKVYFLHTLIVLSGFHLRASLASSKFGALTTFTLCLAEELIFAMACFVLAIFFNILHGGAKDWVSEH